MFMPSSKKAKASTTLPLLKGKAAQVRHVLVPMLRVCNKFLNKHDAAHKKIIELLECAIRMEDAMDQHTGEYALPAGVGAQYKADAERFVKLNTALGHHYHHKKHRGKAMLIFHMTIKFHYLLHLGLVSQYMNPRCAWCYAGESLMHKVRILVQASCRGVSAPGINDKSIKNMLWDWPCRCPSRGEKNNASHSCQSFICNPMAFSNSPPCQSGKCNLVNLGMYIYIYL